MNDKYDFVARHADTHVILGSGETAEPTGPLPRDAGGHVVAGKARLGVRCVGTLPEGVGIAHRETSPDHRWLGVLEDAALVLHDLHDGLRRGFSFHPSSRTFTIHPSGEMVAARTASEVQLLLPDGEVLARVAFPGPVGHLDNEEITFSACGKYLWFAHAPAESEHLLHLLRVPDLRILDRAGVPHDPNSFYGGPGAGWRELALHVNPATNHLVVDRTAGDSLLGVSFLRASRGRISDPLHLAYDENFSRDPINGLAFAEDGKRFAGFDRYGCIYEWKWPGRQVESFTWDHQLRGDEERADLERIAYAGDLLLVTLGHRLHALRSGNLQPVGVLPTWMAAVSLLPNGMLFNQLSDERQRRTVLSLRPSRKETPVVIELGSESGMAERVMQRKKSGWQDVTREVVWVEPSFNLAPRSES